ncbi:MAG: helix-turn-helix transcriptional regulator [Ruminococcus sp.]
MAKNPRQKQKLLFIQKILLEKTDENHGITVNELIKELDKYGITAERKSIYDDIHTLEFFGMDICVEKSKTVKYYVGERDFQISELKLLVDAIQSSKFITEKKSLELIKKLEKLTSSNEARLLQRQVYVSNRVKTNNETIYYNVDRLHDAINKDKTITFYYNQWTIAYGSREKIKLERKRNGEKYSVSPWGLCWDDENYYLIAYEKSSDKIKHYRVDKMEHIEVCDEQRLGKDKFKKFDIASYTKSTFSMFSGKETTVKLSVHNSLIGVIADRFGKNLFITKDEDKEDHFVVKITVNLSEQFYGWLFALGDKIKIIAPNEAVESFKKLAEKVSSLYE